MNSFDIDLPAISFKTVSEFRHLRSAQLKRKHDCAQDTEQAQEQKHYDFSAADTCNSGAESIQKALDYFDSESQSYPAQNGTPTTFVAECSNSSNSALAQFMRKAVDFESAFEYAGTTQSGIDYTNQSIELAKQALELPENKLTLSNNYLTELIEDDGNGRVEPMKESDAEALADIPVPDEPTLKSCRILEDQASVLKDSQEISITSQIIEKDQFGRVIRALYYGQEYVRFYYDEFGELESFNYASMDWTREEDGWSARDRQTDYHVDARISVLESGAMRIERTDVVRTLKQSGTRIDEHKSGSKTESRKLKNKPSPYDLLAKAKAENSFWLQSQRQKNSGPQAVHAPLALDLVNETDCLSMQLGNTEESSMIPSVARVPNQAPGVMHAANLACVPTAPIELRSLERSDKLRSLEDELLEPHRQKVAKSNWNLQLAECFLKSSLWLRDRISGQSSPKHLEHLDRLAELYFEQQRYDLAELTHLRALHIREQHYGKNQPELANNVLGLAAIYEARGNYLRAEQLYKDAISLQESGLRKIIFLFSEKVTDEGRLSQEFESLFCCINGLCRLYLEQGKKQLCAVVLEKAESVWQEIIDREPGAKQVLTNAAGKYLERMREMSV